MSKIEFTEEQQKIVYYIIEKEVLKVNKSKLNDRYSEELYKILNLLSEKEE